MESVSSIALTITEPMVGSTVNIKDAFYHVPIHWWFQVFFTFLVDGKVYVFQ